jgi:mannobiose 2-epimerase
MSSSTTNYLATVRADMHHHLMDELIPFWLGRSIDQDHGGFLTAFDKNGTLVESQTDKFIVMQTRMVWSFSRFSRFLAHDTTLATTLKAAAQQGVQFLLDHMWDTESGGWLWQCSRHGQAIDANKVIYGQSFAMYALAEYTLATGDPCGIDYADRTFDLLQRYSADVAHGGYYEYFTRDWTPAAGNHFSSTHKTLNTHMHLMEAFTTLSHASKQEIHIRRLKELIELITKHMIDPESGAGHDMFDLEFNPLPSSMPPVFLTSYGHDIELVWLLTEAGEALGQPRDAYLDITRGLAAHALEHGLDRNHGGLYTEGHHNGPALSLSKGWWQQAEALVGLLDLYDITHEDEYIEAFQLVWEFTNQHMINHAVGEWYSLLTDDGQMIQSALGHPWKAAYHTGRAMIESLLRLDRIL